MKRLRKIAGIEDLDEMNMPSDVLNQVVLASGEDIRVEKVVYRRLMEKNIRFIVEMWLMSNNTYGVFSGDFGGMWTINNIKLEGNFKSQSEAELYVQTNLQDKAEYGEAVMIESRLKRVDFLKKQAAGKEPDYKEIADGFKETVDINIPEVEKGHSNSFDKYYSQFEGYMKKYYPEWAKYPAFIWGGWGYFIDSFKNEESKETPEVEDKQEEQVQEQSIETTEVQDTPEMSMDMGFGDVE